MSLSVVWFREDLRVHDHAPLIAASKSGQPVVSLFVVKPARTDPEVSPQAAYLDACLNALDDELRALGGQLSKQSGHICDVLTKLHSQHGVDGLYTHCASPTAQATQEMSEVEAWCRRAGVAFRVFDPPGTGTQASAKVLQAAARPAPLLLRPAPLRTSPPQDHAPTAPRRTRAAGRCAALQRLSLAVQSECSGLAADAGIWPDLALGVLSARDVYATWSSRLAEFSASGDFDDLRRQARLMDAWQNRLLLGAQAREDLGRRTVYRAHEHALAPQPRQLLMAGQTGMPLVDACMRALVRTGELNRVALKYLLKCTVAEFGLDPAGVADLLGDHLIGADRAWLHGLALEFGSSASSTSPRPAGVQLAQMVDPAGFFVRDWVPELSRLSNRHIHAPWMAGARVLSVAGIKLGETYPFPILGDPLSTGGRETPLVRNRHQLRFDFQTPAPSGSKTPQKSIRIDSKMRKDTLFSGLNVPI